MNGHIRYIAINAERPDVLARFYTIHLGLRELGRSAGGDVSLTDGWVNLSLLKWQPGAEEPRGLSHYGVAIDDIRELEARLEEFAPRADIQQDKGGVHHGEYRVLDPNGFPVSVSTRAFGTGGPVNDRARIRHVAMRQPNNDAVLDFVSGVFGFREIRSSLAQREKGMPHRFAGDGIINLAILSNQPVKEGPKSRPLTEQQLEHGWVCHFGFVMPNMLAMMAGLPEESGRAAAGEGLTMVEYEILDPEHNCMDFSQNRGFEVDRDVWERAA